MHSRPGRGRVRAGLEGLPERLLARLWHRRGGGARLRTLDGCRLEVLYPGRPGPGAGPDFQDALLRMDGELVRGDVELHRDARGWRAHGHHRDPRYNGVVLHGVGDEGEAEAAPLANGGRAPTVSLAPLTRRPPRSARAHLGTLGCLAGLGPQRLAQALDEAGERRFLEGSDRFVRRFGREGPEQALYSGILEALGYTENRVPFVELAQRLPVALLRAVALSHPAEKRRQVMEDLLLGASGLVAPGPAWRRWCGGTPMARGDWCFSGIRPGNHPERRLRGAATLLARYLVTGLLPKLAAVVMEARPAGLLAALQAPAPEGETRALIGAGRAGDIAGNVVVPALHAFATLQRNAPLATSCRRLYAGLPPLQENGVTREARSLLGEGLLAGVAMTARRQQGLIGLYRAALAAPPGGEAF